MLHVQVEMVRACDASASDVLASNGVALCAPENLGSVSGEMKEFLDTAYYDLFDNDDASLVAGRPYCLAIAAGSDGTGAARQVERVIARGWRLRAVAPTVVHRNGLVQTKANILKRPKPLSGEGRVQCADLGGLLAATIILGMSTDRS
jgi:multimeric flavodoxin WrbA